MYDVSDSGGGLSDITRPAYNWNCQSPRQGTQLSTRTILSGQWGSVPGFNGWQMRDALIRTMWRLVEVSGQQQSYPIYTDCSGYGRERTPGNFGAACGPYARARCPDSGRCGRLLECQRFTWGHKMPSRLRINAYNRRDGSLRADNYQVDFSSASTLKGGCGKVGAVVEALTNFIPAVGGYISAGVKVACRE